MKRRILLLLIAVVLMSPQVFGQRELLDRVIAVVNNEPITQSELDMLLKPVYQQYREQYRGEELIVQLNEARQKLLNQLIEDRLVSQEAENQGIEADPAEIEQNMEKFKAQFPDDMAMEEALSQQGMTLTDVRERFRRQAMIRRLHTMEIRSHVVISPKEIEEYYRDNASEFAEQERIKTRSITVKKSYETREKGLKDEEAKRKIEDIRRRILAGEDFSKLARQYSEDTHAEEGGMSEWVDRGAMIPVIDDVIFSLELGEISDIIETPMGYHLFRVEEKEQGTRRELDEVRDEIHAKLYQQKSEDRFYDWMQELKRNAYISIR